MRTAGPLFVEGFERKAISIFLQCMSGGHRTRMAGANFFVRTAPFSYCQAGLFGTGPLSRGVMSIFNGRFYGTAGETKVVEIHGGF